MICYKKILWLNRIKFFIIGIGILFCCISYASNNILLKTIDNQSIEFNSLKGKWVVIHYWASWCQGCLDEIHTLNSFYHQVCQSGNKVALFAVNYDMPSITIQKRVIKKYKIDYPSLKENPAQSLQLNAINGLPVTFIFNPDGKLSHTLYGPQTMTSLKHAVKLR